MSLCTSSQEHTGGGREAIQRKIRRAAALQDPTGIQTGLVFILMHNMPMTCYLGQGSSHRPGWGGLAGSEQQRLWRPQGGAPSQAVLPGLAAAEGQTGANGLAQDHKAKHSQPAEGKLAGRAILHVLCGSTYYDGTETTARKKQRTNVLETP